MIHIFPRRYSHDDNNRISQIRTREISTILRVPFDTGAASGGDILPPRRVTRGHSLTRALRLARSTHSSLLVIRLLQQAEFTGRTPEAPRCSDDFGRTNTAIRSRVHLGDSSQGPHAPRCVVAGHQHQVAHAQVPNVRRPLGSLECRDPLSEPSPTEPCAHRSRLPPATCRAHARRVAELGRQKTCWPAETNVTRSERLEVVGL